MLMVLLLMLGKELAAKAKRDLAVEKNFIQRPFACRTMNKVTDSQSKVEEEAEEQIRKSKYKNRKESMRIKL
jgi:hypothetical protein